MLALGDLVEDAMVNEWNAQVLLDVVALQVTILFELIDAIMVAHFDSKFLGHIFFLHDLDLNVSCISVSSGVS